MSATAWLLVTYLLAAVSEVVGIKVTVSTYLAKDSDSGLYDIKQAETKWQAIRGPLFIVLGVLIGLGGNIASLYTL